MILLIPVIVLLLAPVFSASVTLNGRFMPATKTNSNLWYTKYGPAPSFANKRNTQGLTRQAKSYENNQGPSETKSVDLHKGEFCVDVSAYGPVTYDKKAVKVCDTSFVKQCEDRSEQVCDDVTEIVCDIVPYTECEMLMENTPYKSFEVIQKLSKKKVCSTGTDVVKHNKLMPECRNVTKQNCITKWETDANGKQVWAGNEACEPVTWRECKLVPKQVDFKVPKITCEDGEDIAYDDYIDVEKNQMTARMVCQLKHATNCDSKVSNKCKWIKFQECYEEPIEKCENKIVEIPKQEKEHKKKCLLTNDDALPSVSTVAPSPTVYSTPSPNTTPSVPTYPPVPQSTVPQPSYKPASQPSYQPARGGRAKPGFGRVLKGNFQG